MEKALTQIFITAIPLFTVLCLKISPSCVTPSNMVFAFSWRWYLRWCVLSCVQPCSPWTVAHQAPLWLLCACNFPGSYSSREFSQPRDRTQPIVSCIPCIDRRIPYNQHHLGRPFKVVAWTIWELLSFPGYLP